MTAQLMPVACLAGVLVGLGMLNRNGELLALQGLGISRVGIALPLLLTAVVISLAAFGLNETIVPAATRRSKYLLDGVIRKDPGFVYTTRNWLRTRDSFVAVKGYDAVHKRLAGIRVFQIGPHYALDEIYSAEAADWNGNDWVFSGPQGAPGQSPEPTRRGLAARLPSGGQTGRFFIRDSQPRGIQPVRASIPILRNCGATAWIPEPTWWTAMLSLRYRCRAW
jgi:lipopolysaccharide export LptBFGC system permease protein LptF